MCILINECRRRVSLATMSSSADSRWSSVRRHRSQYGGRGRRMSRVTDDEFDELAFMQQQVPSKCQSPGNSKCAEGASIKYVHIRGRGKGVMEKGVE